MLEVKPIGKSKRSMSKARRPVFFVFLTLFNSLNAETIPSIIISNYKTEEAYLINYNEIVIAPTYKEACLLLPGCHWGIVPSKSDQEACYSPSWNVMIIGTTTWYCADGSVSYFNPWSACNEFNTCPDPTWTLSEDKLTCSRPDFSCIANPQAVSEIKLLAAIAYGEASTVNNFEEIAAIANAVVRKRNAYNYTTINDLVAAHPNFIRAILKQNERYRQVMCAPNPSDYTMAYQAATNALDPNGIDYANGGCFWDGLDLKTYGKKHDKYLAGFTYTNPAHNIFNTPESPPQHVHSTHGNYDYAYESTAAYGSTIFWKYTSQFITSSRAKPCH